MNLNSTQLSELNQRLMTEKLDLPPFRKEVNHTGANYAWLQKNITKKNPNVSQELKTLLGIH